MNPRFCRAAGLLAVAGAPVLSSCAAVLGSKTAEVPAVSEPPGAEVYLDGNRVGTTPVTLRLPHKRSATLVFKRAGYRDATCFLQSSTQAGWVVLDVLFGLVPIVIDAATGDSSAPNEIVSDAVRANRRAVVGDTLRLGTIAAIEQGPVGVLRTALGETFYSSTSRDLQYSRGATS